MANGSQLTCDQAEELLSGLIDERLEPAEHAAILRHVIGCERCRATLTALRANAAALGELREVAVPAGFVKGVEARLPQPARRSLVTRLFIPWQVKVPIQAAALVLLGVGSVLLFRSSPNMQRTVREADRFQAPAVPLSGEGQEKVTALRPPVAPEARDQARPPASADPGRPAAKQRAGVAPTDRLKAQAAPAPLAEAGRADEADAKRKPLAPRPSAESRAAEPAPKRALIEPRSEVGPPASAPAPGSAVESPKRESSGAGSGAQANAERPRDEQSDAARRDRAKAPEAQKDLRSAMEASESQREVAGTVSRGTPAQESAKRQALAKTAVASIRLRVPNSIEAAARLREGLAGVGAEVAPGSGEPLQILVLAGRYDALLALLRTVGEVEGKVPVAPDSPDAPVRLTIRLLSR